MANQMFNILCLQRNHPAIHKSLYKPRQKAAASGDVQPSVSPMLGPVDKKWKPTDPRQVQLTSRLVSFVAHDLMPLSVVDSTAFREFVFEGTPAFVIPSRKHLSYTLLPQRAEQVRVDLKRHMHIADVVYLTVDLWSSRDMRSFIGIKGHFVNDFVLHTVMVACKRFHGSHTRERIHQVFEETLTTNCWERCLQLSRTMQPLWWWHSPCQVWKRSPSLTVTRSTAKCYNPTALTIWMTWCMSVYPASSIPYN